MQTNDTTAVILVDRQSRLLLQHRTDDAPTYPGHWSFFGGGVELGETPLQAVIREAFEELSYTLTNPTLLATRPLAHQGRSYARFIFVEHYDGSDLVLGEGQSMGWFLPFATYSLLMNGQDREVVEVVGASLER